MTIIIIIMGRQGSELVSYLIFIVQWQQRNVLQAHFQRLCWQDAKESLLCNPLLAARQERNTATAAKT